MRVVNLSRLAAVALPTMCRADHERALIVATGSFAIPVTAGGSLLLFDEQRPPALSDEFHGDPTSSSLRREGQAVYGRPGTDIYLRGHAWAPQGRPASESDLYLRVGPCARHAIVFGERVWVRTIGSIRASPPASFERMPIVWERSFGGTPKTLRTRSLTVAARNPVGCGLFDDSAEAADRQLPNFEDPGALISSLDDRPMPVGFGPIARHWQPRRGHAGTYDRRWLETRNPLWPTDMDERFFCAAAPGLSAISHLRGDEDVELLGVHPDGPLRFRLPNLVPSAKFTFADHIERRDLVLDAIDIDTDALCLTMIWRATSGPADGRLASLESITLRVLADWERA
jgi:hypothetical protein